MGAGTSLGLKEGAVGAPPRGPEANPPGGGELCFWGLASLAQGPRTPGRVTPLSVITLCPECGVLPALKLSEESINPSSALLCAAWAAQPGLPRL